MYEFVDKLLMWRFRGEDFRELIRILLMVGNFDGCERTVDFP